jgi:hypothetical protein
MKFTRALTVLAAVAATWAAIPSAHAQEQWNLHDYGAVHTPTPPPSEVGFYVGMNAKWLFFDQWTTAAGGTYNNGYLVAVEGGLYYIDSPIYLSFGGEFDFLGHADTSTADQDFMLYGGVARFGYGIQDYNFGLAAGGGWITIDESGAGLPDEDGYYLRFGVFFDRVVWSHESGLKIWFEFGVDYYWTTIDAVDRLRFWALSIRLFFWI